MGDRYEHDAFLSYSSRDRERVQRVAERLRQDGVKVWFDQFEIEPGTHIYLEIEEGLQASRKLVLFMSEYAFGSDWVGPERGAVHYRDPRNRKRSLIPVLLEDCEIPDFLRPYRHIDLRQDSEETYQELLEALRVADTGPSAEPQQQPLAARGRRAGLFPRLACPEYLRPPQA